MTPLEVPERREEVESFPPRLNSLGDHDQWVGNGVNIPLSQTTTQGSPTPHYSSEEDLSLRSQEYDQQEGENSEHGLNRSKSRRKDRICINVGGIRHETYRSTLKNIPDTRLAWLAETAAVNTSDYDAESGEFFFDRHPTVFPHILNYYRTGKLHTAYDVCGPLFEDELSYWGIDDTQVESCCWINYRQHRDAQETLKEFEGIEFENEFDEESEPDLARYGFKVMDNEISDHRSFYERWQPSMWRLFEEPYSSRLAKAVAIISMTSIIVSILLFCLETLETFRNSSSKRLVIVILEAICVTWFTFELTARFIFCPDHFAFIKSITNWIDFFSIIPFFVTLIVKYGFGVDSVFWVQLLRLIRVFRIIKLSKHSMGLQILGHTLKASFSELLLLIFFLLIGIVIFSSLVYYCEKDEKGTKFESIPTTFWWAVITMTTVGYGDMVPETIGGKIVGSLCAVSGVLMIALPVPVIVNNFNLYYSHAQARLKLPKKRRRVLCNAANALKGPALEAMEAESNGSLDSAKSADENPQFRMTITEDNATDELPASEDDFREKRLKKFSRRESHLFGGIVSAAVEDTNLSKSPNIALQKRRSLMPALPENDH